MDIFAQKKLLIRLVAVLAILNLLCIGVVIWKLMIAPPSPPPQEPVINDRDVSEILRRELRLSDDQVEQIRQLRNDFAREEKRLTDAIRRERDSMNSLMFSQDTREEQIRLAARNISDLGYEMEMLRFRQSEELKSICTPEQQVQFQRLVREIRDYLKPDRQPQQGKPGKQEGPGKRPPKRPPRDSNQLKN